MKLDRIADVPIFAKAEYLNPGGSIKDRVARHMIEQAEKRGELKKEISGLFVPGQFVNPDNPDIHYLTTGREIWTQMDGRVDAFVAGVGSGGTLAGVARLLKEKNPAVRIAAVEPANASALLGQEPGPPHRRHRRRFHPGRAGRLGHRRRDHRDGRRRDQDRPAPDPGGGRARRNLFGRERLM